MKKWITLLLLTAVTTLADDLAQLYEKAYFLETAKGQTEEALDIYRQIAATEVTDENRAIILKTLDRMQRLYSVHAKKTLQEKVDNFDIKNGGLEEVLSTFGEPKHYVFGQETFSKSNLPDVYVMLYPQQLNILMKNNRVAEFRFEESNEYEIQGISVGITLPEAMEILGKPATTITTTKIAWEEDTLYLTTTGKWKDHAYIAKKGLRLFFREDVLFALYITDNTILDERDSKTGDAPFELCGDGTVKDHSTGLMWIEQPITFRETNWRRGSEICQQLSVGGHTDWRLPGINEIVSLYEHSASKTDLFKGHPFKIHTQKNTSSNRAVYWCQSLGKDHAGTASPIDGWSFRGRHKDGAGYTWPVRMFTTKDSITPTN